MKVLLPGEIGEGRLATYQVRSIVSASIMLIKVAFFTS
jgi:hypothetical protein